MKVKLLLICVLLVAATWTPAQTITVISDQGTVVCSPRYARLMPRTNPYAAYFYVTVTTATTLNRLKVTMGTKTQFSPFPGATLIIDQKLYASTMIRGEGNTYGATFADFQAPLSAGSHIIEVDLINEVNAYRIEESFGTRVTFTINNASDMGFESGNFLTPFPVNLGSMTVAPGYISPVLALIGENYRPRVARDVIASIMLNPTNYISGPTTLSSVTVTTEDGLRMPRLALLDKFGFIITRPTKQEGNKVTLVLDEPFVMTSESNEVRLMADASRMPAGHVVLNLEGKAFRFSIAETRMTTEPCTAAGSLELDYY